MHQAQAAPAALETHEATQAGARVIPLFRGRQASEMPLVTVANGHWRKPNVARHLSVSERTIERWMQHEGLPHEKPFGKKGPVRFDPRKIEAWWAARCRNGVLTFGAGFCLFMYEALSVAS